MSTQMQTNDQPEPTGEDIPIGQMLAGKYMTFKLGAEEYGLEILKVREIIGLLDITRIPRTPKFIRGVINLRGKIIPVVDLRLKFGMAEAEGTDQTVIIVVQFKHQGDEVTTGLLVDEVMEVLDIHAEKIEPAPSVGNLYSDRQYILGVGKADKRVIFLLAINGILSSGETCAVLQTVRAATETAVQP